jgi:ATP/maltotriose-dependent transcriptional regulator MalT
LNEGLNRRLTVISAPAGFGKTSLVAEWVAGCGRPAAWLSLDGEDGDPARFLTYLVLLRTLAERSRQLRRRWGGVLGRLQAQPRHWQFDSPANDIAAIRANSSSSGRLPR